MGMEMEHIQSHNWLCMANGAGTGREEERGRERESFVFCEQVNEEIKAPN